MANQMSDQPRVIVIGAGFSGLACAYELAKVGYQVQVFEARDRVGGRIHSLGDLVPGKIVEAGGEFLGSNHPHVNAYAEQFGFEFLDVTEDDVAPPPIILDGRKLLPQEVKQIKAEAQAALAQLTAAAQMVLADEPWNTPDAGRLDRLSMGDWIAEQDISDLAKTLLTVRFTGLNGVVPQCQSLLATLTVIKGGGLEKYWTDSEVYRLKGGNQQFALRFAEELGDDRVTLNCPISEITATTEGMQVVDAKGNEYVADDVVLAIPPSVWSRIQFSPELPSVLRPQMGKNVKFLAVVNDQFWKADRLPPNGTTDRDITQVWHGTDGQGDSGAEVLIAFSGGAAAEANHLRHEPERQADYLDAYEALFPGFKTNFVKGQFVDWIEEKWTRGGYSFPAPGEVTTVGPALRKGVGHLHFAGEHACYKFVGYMEGALHAGVELAQQLATRDHVAVKT
jgi:monoamine oxidase